MHKITDLLTNEKKLSKKQITPWLSINNIKKLDALATFVKQETGVHISRNDLINMALENYIEEADKYLKTLE